MKKFEERFTAWVDGRLDPAEREAFEAELAADPGWADEKNSAAALGQWLRECTPIPPLDNPDFFNHGVMERIRVAEPKPLGKSPWAALLGPMPRLALASLAVLAFALLYFTTDFSSSPEPRVVAVSVPTAVSAPAAEVLFANAPDPLVSAVAFSAPDQTFAVIWLDGLDYLPADHRVQ